MQFLLLTMLLMASDKTRYGQSAKTAKAADYTISIHVQASRLVNECWSDNKGSSCSPVQHLTATIDGKKYDLARVVDGNMFRVGNYKAQIVEERKPRREEYTRT
jgi:hypothetical protein